MKRTLLILLSLFLLASARSQEDQAGIALDLKKARAAYEIAKQNTITIRNSMTRKQYHWLSSIILKTNPYRKKSIIKN